MLRHRRAAKNFNKKGDFSSTDFRVKKGNRKPARKTKNSMQCIMAIQHPKGKGKQSLLKYAFTTTVECEGNL